MEDDDGVLTLAAARGDRAAFRALVDRHYDAALRYALRMLGNRADAEDAVQETFIRAYRSLPQYREEGRFRAWVFKILVNRCRTHVDGRNRRGEVLLSADRVPAAALPAREPAPSAPFRREAIRSAVEALPVTLREAFLLKYVEEWTYREMAELTGASVSALKMRVARARETLRSQLQEMHDDG
ncbi:MAG: sigma-70 family RNA polymerase sigma factor [Gemmatimonadetes bacterium]|nr:RNA polymerase sigma factor [Gemmatimonadota bacterium]NIQ55172.1 RNA polymerase sigma factor [Gemmatimonadota bacterium]NIU75371.1 sigma-70 family RNA polymerase sigma factor [Gammaproteobacteria bacterium]NIX45147.1 sigma-70 family RNA polymerase sigma factor [Gemmatimonadota bacterium]NIY09392.1 sigma-70 family RNA polymerase sigma factor [Gemmatimonadota bacterium]